MKSIILGVCGSIAAYKAADLTSKLVKRGHAVFVVMTENATQFVGPMTFQTLSKNPVTSGVFDERESWRPTHIDLADRADLLPRRSGDRQCSRQARARNLRRRAHLHRACHAGASSRRASDEWKNVAASGNARKCRNAKSARRDFIGPEEGMLACGYEGIGRLWNVDEIVDES